jgi:hypothetical protein
MVPLWSALVSGLHKHADLLMQPDQGPVWAISRRYPERVSMARMRREPPFPRPLSSGEPQAYAAIFGSAQR